MRPKSLVWFDRFYLGALAVAAITSITSFGHTLAFNRAQLNVWQYGSPTLVVMVVLGWSISLLIWYFISRRASNAAKWIWLAFFVLDLVTAPLLFRQVSVGAITATTLALMLVQKALKLAAVIFLFRPDARRWFAAKGQAVDPDVFS